MSALVRSSSLVHLMPDDTDDDVPKATLASVSSVVALGVC